MKLRVLWRLLLRLRARDQEFSRDAEKFVSLLIVFAGRRVWRGVELMDCRLQIALEIEPFKPVKMV